MTKQSDQKQPAIFTRSEEEKTIEQLMFNSNIEKNHVCFDSAELEEFDELSEFDNQHLECQAKIPFEEARMRARNLNLTQDEYLNLPLEILHHHGLFRHADRIYKLEFVNWRDYLNPVHEKNKSNYYSYSKAKSLVRQLNLLGKRQYQEYWRENKCVQQIIPNNARGHYAMEWVSWNDYLGHGRKGTAPAKTRSDDYLCFEAARALVIQAGIKSRNQYNDIYKTVSNKLPSTPHRTYKKLWQGWPYFTGK
jgi:hypothetical protein